MKKFLKKLNKINLKGFTLVELLGVIVIMGLIIIVAIPSVSQLINRNNEQEYQTYYEVVEEAALAYAGKLRGYLGGSEDTGCYKLENPIEKLQTEGLLAQKKGECDEVSPIVIKNDNGKVSVEFKLTCKKNGETYEIGRDISGETCENYVAPESSGNLMNVLQEARDASGGGGTSYYDVNNDVYLTGISNNYLWYSGKMWRIVSYNKMTEEVKIVTNDSIISTYYNRTSSSNNFSGSDIETWLNNEFLNSLKDPQTFLTSTSWKTSTSTTRKAKVGLITEDEYSILMHSSWYNDGNKTWLITSGSTAGLNKISNSGVEEVASTDIYGVRPIVVLSSDILVYGGDGTSGNPYIIDNSKNAVGSSGDAINTRYSGEYVELYGKFYRIVSVTATGKTKIIGTTSEGTYAFDTNGKYLYSESTLLESLTGNLTDIITDSDKLLTTGDYCLETIDDSYVTSLTSKCIDESRINSEIKIGLPKLGDLFTSSISGVGDYWTMNPQSEESNSPQINIIATDSSGSAAGVTETKATIIVLYLDSSVKIAGGEGTSASPYTLTK